jgi:hypothetical protein
MPHTYSKTPVLLLPLLLMSLPPLSGLQTCAGLFYCFSLYSAAVKAAFGFDQAQIQVSTCLPTTVDVAVYPDTVW